MNNIKILALFTDMHCYLLSHHETCVHTHISKLVQTLYHLWCSVNVRVRYRNVAAWWFTNF